MRARKASLNMLARSRGLAALPEAPRAPEHRYLDYTGREIAW
jgi:hypothetical protein